MDEVHLNVITTKRRRIRPDIIIVSLLLLIPLGVATFCFLPRYYVFTAPGELVSIQDVGVNGSVHFVYVYEGYTRNLYERWSTQRSVPDAEFVPADASVVAEFGGMEEI